MAREGIGLRVARIRATADITQQQLADRVGVTKAYISLIENGHRAVTKRQLLDDLASALGVSATDLTGQPYPATNRGDLETYLVVPRIREALEEPEDGPSVPRSLDQLELAADRAAVARMACDTASLGRYLPGLLADTRVLWFDRGDRAAGALLVKGAFTGALALKSAGFVDLGIRLAELADTVATALGDPVSRAAAQYAIAQCALATGGRRRSARLATATAEELDRLTRTKVPPMVLNDTFAWLAAVHLHAALSVAGMDSGDPSTHLAEAGAAAARVTGDPWRMEVSPANVGTWAVGIALESGHAEDAPSLARRVNPQMLRTPQRRSRLHLDHGRALYVTGDQEGAVRAFLHADDAAPGDLRARVTAVELVAQMVRDSRERGGSPELRDLALRVGVDPAAPGQES